jgi:DNA repair ATPase RecN
MSPRQPSFLDTLAGLIPGYTGYAEREKRRSQDKRLRDHVALELDRSKRQLDVLIEMALQRGELEGLDEVDALKRSIGTCADTPAGASGLMDDVVVKEADLDRVLQHDHGLHAKAEELTTSISSLTSSTFRAALGDVRRLVRELENAIQQRDTILSEVFH